LLAYKVPPEPTRTRVGIWRSIKSLGAVYLQSSVCVLPKSAQHERQLKLLQNKIVEAGGIADVLETAAMDRQQESAIIRRFRQDREAEYQEFLGKCDDYLGELRHETRTRHFTFAELQENDEDLEKLKGWLEKIKALDFYGTPAAVTAERRLDDCTVALDAFAARVFEIEQQSRPASRPKPFVKSTKRGR
jgi:vacuolar-type H+-ATPase subunit I/STV1